MGLSLYMKLFNWFYYVLFLNFLVVPCCNKRGFKRYTTPNRIKDHVQLLHARVANCMADAHEYYVMPCLHCLSLRGSECLYGGQIHS